MGYLNQRRYYTLFDCVEYNGGDKGVYNGEWC